MAEPESAVVVREAFEGHSRGDRIEGAEADRILESDHAHKVHRVPGAKVDEPVVEPPPSAAPTLAPAV